MRERIKGEEQYVALGWTAYSWMRQYYGKEGNSDAHTSTLRNS